MGSSPLARGLPVHAPSQTDRSRIIPARAGFTASRWDWRSGWRDHPRSRGVYLAGAGGAVSPSGSSPLARGLPRQPQRARHAPGIIPARAGFTPDEGGSGACRQDHPRSRGVYERRHLQVRQRRGSSPLARGLQERGRRTDEFRGIIPARAGFTVVYWVRTRTSGDHPRSRGVYA